MPVWCWARKGDDALTPSKLRLCACLYLKHAQEHFVNVQAHSPFSLAFGVVGVRHRLPVLAISHA